MYKDIDFSENNPTINNIDTVFGKILFCLTSAFMYDEYLDIRDDIKVELDKFNILLKTYTNTKKLLELDFAELNNIAKKISTMDCQTVVRDGQYLEMADIWLSILIGYYKLLGEEVKNGKR